MPITLTLDHVDEVEAYGNDLIFQQFTQIAVELLLEIYSIAVFDWYTTSSLSVRCAEESIPTFSRMLAHNTVSMPAIKGLLHMVSSLYKTNFGSQYTTT